jgi:hypothetical protein
LNDVSATFCSNDPDLTVQILKTTVRFVAQILGLGNKARKIHFPQQIVFKVITIYVFIA